MNGVMARCGGLTVGLAMAAAVAGGQTLADRLLAPYDPIRSVTCEIRKDTRNDAGQVRMLSRVQYLKPDRLNVENILPVARRIVADGQTFYSYIQGDPKGFSRPVAQLNEEMTIQLRKVPGTPMDHLMRLRGAPETELPPAPDLPVRRGYALPKMFVVLGVDATGRLARVEFYTDARMQERTGYYNFRLFHEVLPGVWIPYLHEGHVVIQGHENTEVSRIMNYTVNQPLASNLFVAAPFFPSVEFVDEFEKIYP